MYVLVDVIPLLGNSVPSKHPVVQTADLVSTKRCFYLTHTERYNSASPYSRSSYKDKGRIGEGNGGRSSGLKQRRLFP